MTQAVTPIIGPGEMGKYIHQQGVIFIDARGGPDACNRYQKGHLDGALFFDLETELSQKGPNPAFGGRHPLPDPEKFGILLGKKGIQPSHHLLVYDDRSGSNAAARFWWMMKAAGHGNIQVIDGGYAAICAAGLPEATGEGSPLPSAQPYSIRSWKLPLADIEMVDKLRMDDDYLILDVRENYRYQGESEPIDLVAGHIPGAVNAPFLDSLEADGRFRSPEVLAKQYKALIGARKGEKLIVHCGSGVTACHTLLALDMAGIKGAKLYPGSWSEWSRREKPRGKGPNPV